MNLSEKNLFARYYNWMYRGLPDDVCTFFWGSVLIILLFPLFVPGRLFGDKWDHMGDDASKSLGIYFLLFISLLFGLIPYSIIGKEHAIYIWLVSLNDWVEILVITLTGAIELFLMAMIVMSVGYLIEKRRENRRKNYTYSDEPTTFDKTMNFIGAIRGKYCTKINWK